MGNTKLDFGKLRLPVKCPTCKSELTVTAKQIEEGTKFTCPQGHVFQLMDTKDSMATMRKKLEKIISDFKKRVEER